jgi:germination protein M
MRINLSLVLCILLLAVVSGLSACAPAPAPAPDPVEEPVDVVEEPADTQDYQVKLYFANEEYVNSGDESLEWFMPPEAVTITSTPADIYKAAIEALKTLPAKEHYSTMLTPELIINKVYVEGDTAYVDLARENLNGSSTQEGFLISQIVQTLRNNFAEVKQVQFLVDGAIVESLMGHIAADKPFTE